MSGESSLSKLLLDLKKITSSRGYFREPIRKFPEPSKQVLEGEAALVAAIVAGILPTRSVDEARMKPMPMRFAPDLSHLGNCTACLNAEAWWKAASHSPRPCGGAQWSCQLGSRAPLGPSSSRRHRRHSALIFAMSAERIRAAW